MHTSFHLCNIPILLDQQSPQDVEELRGYIKTNPKFKDIAFWPHDGDYVRFRTDTTGWLKKEVDYLKEKYPQEEFRVVATTLDWPSVGPIARFYLDVGQGELVLGVMPKVVEPVAESSTITYLNHLIANFRVAWTGLRIFGWHFVHGLIPIDLTSHETWDVDFSKERNKCKYS